MSGGLVKIPINTLKAIKEAFGEDGLPKPFVKEVFLMSCHVAGTGYQDGAKEAGEELKDGDIMVLLREPDNPHDALAIQVLDEKSRKLGYVPRKKNEVVARLMDAGKLVFGKVENHEVQDEWLRIKIRVFMRDY